MKREASERNRDAPYFGLAALLLTVGAISGAVPVFWACAVGACALVMRSVPNGGLGAALAVGLLWSNAAVVTGQRVGVPSMVAIAPQVLLGALVLGRAIAGRRTVVVTPAFRALLLYGAALFAAGIIAEFPEDVPLEYATFLFEGALLWFLVVNVIDEQRSMERALTVLVVVAGFIGAVTLVQYATETFGDEYAGFGQLDADERELYQNQDDYTPRLSGPTGEKNRFAQVLLVSLPIGIALARRQRPLAKAVYLSSSMLTVGGIAVSGSRGAAIGAVVVLGILAAYRIITAVGLAAVAAAVISVMILLPGYRERVVSTIDAAGGLDDSSGEVDGSTLSRITENLAALNMFLDHPVLGVGSGGYPAQYEAYAERVGLNVRDGQREPHNLYLGTAAELGLVGLLALLGVFAVVLRDLHLARRAVRRIDSDLADLAAGAVASIVAYLVTGVFLHLSFERYLWLQLAVLDATARVIRQVAERRDEAAASRSVPVPVAAGSGLGDR